jgi:hypothetical protein
MDMKATKDLTHIAAFPPRVVKFQLKTGGFCLEFFT